MGGHGGLNILPQKKWNVYNYENREKVRQDEEAAAREEQLKREQSRMRDAEFRIERLRNARKLPNSPSTSQAESHHINLFENCSKNDKKRRREDVVAVKLQAEDEKYKLGYGLVGKDVKTPWYASKTSFLSTGNDKEGDFFIAEDCGRSLEVGLKKKKDGGRKTVEELREERIKRERKEKERERLVLGSLGMKREDRRLKKGF